MWITVIISGTEWNNFFALRCHEAAEPHFQELARTMRSVREASVPKKLRSGEWHLPLIQPDEVVLDDLPCGCDGALDDGCWKCTPERHPRPSGFSSDVAVKVSVGRCARVSYLTHDGRRDPSEDIGLYDRLRTQNPPHAAPFEHVAMALDLPERSGCLVGFKSHRMTLPNESVLG